MGMAVDEVMGASGEEVARKMSTCTHRHASTKYGVGILGMAQMPKA